jgi:choline dehydrogenase-like flavoprotein
MKSTKKKVLIVGGGTAGLVIQNELSRYCDVIVLEKSQYRSMPIWFRVPISIGILFSKNNEYVQKSSFSGLNDRPIPFFESNCLGGASVINGSVHVVGCMNTYEELFAKYNINSGHFAEYYDSLFSKSNEAAKIRLRLQNSDLLDESFYKTMEKFSVNRGDSEFFDRSACGPIWNTSNNFLRSSVLDLDNYDSKSIFLSSEVEYVEIQDGSVKGVWVDGRLVEADVVVLSAGVIGTNKILSRTLSTQKNIPDALKGHKYLRDHTNIRINIRSKKDIFSLNQLSLPLPQKLAFLMSNAKQLFSILRGSGASSAANIDLYGEGKISLRLNLLRFYESGRLGSGGRLFEKADCGFSLSLTQVNPKSMGVINSDGKINPSYLSDPEDVQFLKDALAYAVNLLRAQPLNDFVGEIIDLENIVHSPEEYIKNGYYSGYHLIGGAAELIDSDFCVKDITGLYVCDASVLSEYPSSNIHSTVLILAKIFAQKLADKINQYVPVG